MKRTNCPLGQLVSCIIHYTCRVLVLVLFVQYITNITYLKILNKNVQILTIFLETYLGPFVAVRVRVFVSLCKITSLKILFLSAGNKQSHPSCTFIQPSLQNTKLHILILAAFISVCEEEIPLFVVRSLYSYSALCHVLHA